MMKIVFPSWTRKAVVFQLRGQFIQQNLEINTNIIIINNKKEHLSHRYVIVPFFSYVADKNISVEGLLFLHCLSQLYFFADDFLFFQMSH